MMSLLRLTLLFVTLLGMALLTAPNNSAATPVNLYGPVYGGAHIEECEKTSAACRRSRELCLECVRSCEKAATASAMGKSGYYFAGWCRTRIGRGVW